MDATQASRILKTAYKLTHAYNPSPDLKEKYRRLHSLIQNKEICSIERLVNELYDNGFISPYIGGTLFNKAQICFRKKEYKECLKYYKKVISVFTLISKGNFLVDSYKFAGKAYFRLKKYEKARIYYSKALNQNSDVGNTDLKAELANILTILNRNEEALEIYKEIVEVEDKVEYMIEMGKLYMKLNKNVDAIIIYNKARDILLGQNEILKVGFVYKELGYLHLYALDNHLEAIWELSVALFIYRQVNKSDKVKEILEILGEIYIKNKLFSDAIRIYKDMCLIEHVNRSERAFYLKMLGKIHYELKEFDQSLDSCFACLKIVENRDERLYVLELIHDNLKEKSFYSEALTYLNTALELTDESTDVIRKVRLLFKSSEIHRLLGNDHNATKIIEKAQFLRSKCSYQFEGKSQPLLLNFLNQKKYKPNR